MNITKTSLLVLIFGLMLFSSCSNEDDHSADTNTKGSAPRIVAEIGNGPSTKAGVIEDNDDYHIGEKLRWAVGDLTSVQFWKNGAVSSTLDYKVTAVEASNPKKCTFEAEEGKIDDGSYTLHGYYPKTGWNLDNLLVTMPDEQGQNGISSDHLADCFFMKAQSTVEVKTGTDLNIHYKHLTSVVRYQIFNGTGNSNLNVKKVELSTSSIDYFGKEAKLDNKEATALTTTSKVDKVALNVTNGAFNADDQFSGFMALLPTASQPDDLTISLTVNDGSSDKTLTKTFTKAELGTFLQDGLQQGKAYYFRLWVTNIGLTTEGNPSITAPQWTDSNW